MKPFKSVAAWLRTRREQRAHDERLLAVMVALASMTPGTPPPSPDAQRWVNRTLNRRVFTEVDA